MVSQHHAKLGGHRYFDIGDIIFSICHVFSQDHVIQKPCDFIGKSHSRQVTALSSFLAIVTVVMEIILRDHVIKGSCDVMGETATN